MRVKQEDIEYLRDVITDNHLETRGWVQSHTHELRQIELQLEALCNYLGIKMEHNKTPYYKITSLGENNELAR